MHKEDDLRMTGTCGNCQFMDDQSETAMKHKKNDFGVCRYNPPTAVRGADALALWPIVGMEDWCGHFAAKVELATGRGTSCSYQYLEMTGTQWEEFLGDLHRAAAPAGS